MIEGAQGGNGLGVPRTAFEEREWGDPVTYAQVDDTMPDHPKVVMLPLEAKWVYFRSICFCSHYLTDGVVPQPIAESWGSQAAAAALVGAGLWIDTGENYTVHDYLDWNRSRVEVLDARERARERSANVRRTNQKPSPVVDVVEAVAVASKTSGVQRKADPLWDAVEAWYGSRPGGDERGAWNRALKSFRQAVPPVEPEEVKRLFDEARRQWSKPFKPTAIAANLTALRATIGSGLPRVIDFAAEQRARAEEEDRHIAEMRDEETDDEREADEDGGSS